MFGKSEVRHPADFRVLLQPSTMETHKHHTEVTLNIAKKRVLCKRKGIIRMSLRTKTESLQSLQHEECSERIKGGPEITENLNPDFDCERGIAEGFAVPHPMIPLRWFGEARELAGCLPIKFACRYVVLAFRPTDEV